MISIQLLSKYSTHNITIKLLSVYKICVHVLVVSMHDGEGERERLIY